MSDYINITEELEDKEDYENFEEFIPRSKADDDDVPTSPAPPPPRGARVTRHSSIISTYSTSSSSSGYPSGGSLSNDDLSIIGGGRGFRLSSFQPKSPVSSLQPSNFPRNRKDVTESHLHNDGQLSDVDEGCYDVIPSDYEILDDTEPVIIKNKPLPPTPPSVTRPDQTAQSATGYDEGQSAKIKFGLKPTPVKAPPKTFTFNSEPNDDDQNPTVRSVLNQFGEQNKPRPSPLPISQSPANVRLRNSNSTPSFPFPTSQTSSTVSQTNARFPSPLSTLSKPHSVPPPVAQKTRINSEPPISSVVANRSPRSHSASTLDSSAFNQGASTRETGSFASTGSKFPGKPTTPSPGLSSKTNSFETPAAQTPVPQPPPFPPGSKFTNKVPPFPAAASSPPPTVPKFPSTPNLTPSWKKTAEEKATSPQPFVPPAAGLPQWKQKVTVPVPPSSTSTPPKWNANDASGASSSVNKFTAGAVATSSAVTTAPTVSSAKSRLVPIPWNKTQTANSASDNSDQQWSHSANKGSVIAEPPPPRPLKNQPLWTQSKVNTPTATTNPSAFGDSLPYEAMPAAPPVPPPASRLGQFGGASVTAAGSSNRVAGRTPGSAVKTPGQRYDPVMVSAVGPSLSSGPASLHGKAFRPTVSSDYEELPADCDSLVKYGWYFGEISRHDSESLLKAGKDGTYLVRKRQMEGGSVNEPYCISVVCNRQVHHVIIRQRPDKLWAIGTPKSDEKKFAEVAQLISFYNCNEISLTVGIQIQLLTCPSRGRCK